MRLIDADAYINYINVALNDAIKEGTPTGIIQCVIISKCIEEDLKNEKITPTIDPERKKGKWLDYLSEGLKYKCSECDSRFDTPWNFCPSCGAKMEL